MLEAAIALQLATGKYAEAGVVTVLLLTNAGLGYFQEGRAQATLDALKSRPAMVAAVRGEGAWTTVPMASPVPGDMVKLSLGSVDGHRRRAGDVVVDRQRAAIATPSIWCMGPLTLAGIGLGIVDLVFCILCLATGKFVLGLDTETLRTLTVATLVFGGQAVFYVARERRHFWSSRPGRWLLLSFAIDLTFVSTLALKGWPQGLAHGAVGANHPRRRAARGTGARGRPRCSEERVVTCAAHRVAAP